MERAAAIPGFSFPMSGALFRLSLSGCELGARSQALELLAGDCAGSLHLAEATGCHVTAVEPDAARARRARESAQALGLDDLVSVRDSDPERLELPARVFDLVIALGSAPTVLGRASLLERSRLYLRPGGRVLLADLVYLDSTTPAAVRRLLAEVESEEPLEARSNAPEPVVRALLESGRHRFESESDYRQLVEALGYEIEFTFLVPESEWAEYFERMSRGLEGAVRDADSGSVSRLSPEDRHAGGEGLSEPRERPAVWSERAGEQRRRLAEEAAAIYALGGRGRVGYLVLRARCTHADE